MIRHNVFLCLFTILGNYLIGHVSTLNMEAIANGVEGDQENFIYQAAIFTKEDSNEESKLVCSGAIVAPKWVLSITSCFMFDHYSVKNLIFMAVVGFTDFTQPGAEINHIKYIYTHLSGDFARFIGLAMAKTDSDMNSPTIQPINTPNFMETPQSSRAIVSGYGCFTVHTRTNELGRREYLQIETPYLLRYTYVNLESSERCSAEFPYSSSHRKYCGVAERHGRAYTGICWNDIGSPAVVDYKVVALATTYYRNCDDTRRGSLYIQTAPYYHFIENSKSDSPTNQMMKFPLREN